MQCNIRTLAWISTFLLTSVTMGEQPAGVTPSAQPPPGSMAALLAASGRDESDRQENVRQDGVQDHPMAPLLAWARQNEERVVDEVRDYTCMMVKRQRIDGQLQNRQCMLAKVRHRRIRDGQRVTPFSVYLKFLYPRKIKDREVLYVEGRNDGEMLVRHGGHWLSSLTFSLDPAGDLAMQGNRYPITELGILPLLRRTIRIGKRNTKHGNCEVSVSDDVEFDHRDCLRIDVKHPRKQPQMDFHSATFYIDKKLQLLTRFESYDRPGEGNESPVLMEQYSYHRLKLNVGLTDADFQRDNPDYGFKPQ